jgi:hypothetical protein
LPQRILIEKERNEQLRRSCATSRSSSGEKKLIKLIFDVFIARIAARIHCRSRRNLILNAKKESFFHLKNVISKVNGTLRETPPKKNTSKPPKSLAAAELVSSSKSFRLFVVVTHFSSHFLHRTKDHTPK